MEETDPMLLTFAITGNVLNLAYNIPFVWTVVKNNSATDISLLFLYLRIFGSLSWLVYSILKPDILVGISYGVTLTSSLIIYYVKIKTTKCIKVKDTKTEIQINNNIVI